MENIEMKLYINFTFLCFFLYLKGIYWSQDKELKRR